MNGAGFLFNHLFGYGVMDAGSLVDAALSWKVRFQISFFGWNHFEYGFISSSGGTTSISAISPQQSLRESRDR